MAGLARASDAPHAHGGRRLGGERHQGHRAVRQLTGPARRRAPLGQRRVHRPSASAPRSSPLTFRSPHWSRRSVTDPGAKGAVQETVRALGNDPQVARVTDPYATGSVSGDGSTAYAQVSYEVPSSQLGEGTRAALLETVEQAGSQELTVEVGGNAVTAVAGGHSSEALGLAVAAVVLVITLGSLLAAGSPCSGLDPPRDPDRPRRRKTRHRSRRRRRGPDTTGRHQPHRQRRGPHASRHLIRVGVGTVDDRAVLEVADEGPGLAPAERDRVFERFYRTDDSRTRTTGGSGSGLGLAHAHAHHGRLSLTTAPGQRCTSRIELPFPHASHRAGANGRA
ncbi:ATP-binding protein [Streptomyces sp. NPDC047315]|uniref:ATP-binding protein n=1 Tax=Streptomyces sp. NPDC047315 TaxID=3155142 RepID=UPI00340D17E4